ncbi:MAG: hypothetical protein M3R13_09350 [Armatimonadota bacterium]|nr:hypothetical protein [Armatimonadota bacterium]
MAQKLNREQKLAKAPKKAAKKKPSTKETFERFAKKHGDALTKLAK